MRKLTNILVTGGAGFIGVNFIRFLLGESDLKSEFKGRIINLDALTYAGNVVSLKEIDEKFRNNRYFFEYGNICDQIFVFKKISAIAEFFIYFFETRRIPCISKCIQVDDPSIEFRFKSTFSKQKTNKINTDKPGTAGHKYV